MNNAVSSVTKLVVGLGNNLFLSSVKAASTRSISTFGRDYKVVMNKPLERKRVPELDSVRHLIENEIEHIKNEAWSEAPISSLVGARKLDNGEKIPTHSDLMVVPVGHKVVMTSNEFESWLKDMSILSEETLLVTDAHIEKMDKCDRVIRDFQISKLRPKELAKYLATAAVDIETNKYAEAEEADQTMQRNQAFSTEIRNYFRNGVLDYNVSKAGIVIAPVVNFGYLLDNQQKAEHAIRNGVPVTWLVRQGYASQQGTREAMRLREVLQNEGLEDMLSIVVLNEEQRNQFMSETGITTLVTGRGDTMEAIHKNVKDMAGSGSGFSTDITLSSRVTLMRRFIRDVVKDATVGTNGFQCTASQNVSGNFSDSSLHRVNFANNILNQVTAHITVEDAVNQQFDDNAWHGAFNRSFSYLPEGISIINRDKGFSVYDSDKQILGEEYTWRKLNLGVSDNKGAVSIVESQLKNHRWLSIGYYPDVDEKQLKEDVSNFCRLLTASKASVGTFNGPCVFSAPQNQGEIFTERATYMVGKVEVPLPRIAPVPRGTALWGPSKPFLANLSDKAGPVVRSLSLLFHLNRIEDGYLMDVQEYTKTALGPHAFDRKNRGPSVEGIITSAEPVSRFIPDVCLSTGEDINKSDIATFLLVLTQTNMRHNTSEILIHSKHNMEMPSIIKFLENNDMGHVSVKCEHDPERAKEDLVQLCVANRYNGNYRLPDEVVLAGNYMAHFKFLDAKEFSPEAKNKFVEGVWEKMNWLRGYK